MHSEIKVTFPGGKKVDAEIKGLMVHTDQAVEDGGEGSAPAPFDYFLVSLATCTGIVALAYCRRKNIPTEGLAVTMQAPWDDERNRCDQVTFHITLPKNFPDDQVEAFRQRVEACAVKKHILQPPEFSMEIKPFPA